MAAADEVTWLAEIACPRCGARESVPVLVSGVRLVVTGRNALGQPTHALVADFVPGETSHRCLDPTRDRTGAAFASWDRPSDREGK